MARWLSGKPDRFDNLEKRPADMPQGHPTVPRSLSPGTSVANVAGGYLLRSRARDRHHSKIDDERRPGSDASIRALPNDKRQNFKSAMLVALPTVLRTVEADDARCEKNQCSIAQKLRLVER
jgi:hypothetical protein